MTDKEIEAIAEAVLHKILNAPSRVEVTLRGPVPGKSFSTLLPGCPGPGRYFGTAAGERRDHRRWKHPFATGLTV